MEEKRNVLSIEHLSISFSRYERGFRRTNSTAAIRFWGNSGKLAVRSSFGETRGNNGREVQDRNHIETAGHTDTDLTLF